VLSAVGDVGFSGRPALKGPVDATKRFFEPVKTLLAGSDVAMCNFEGILASAADDVDPFTSSPEWATVLADAGFGLVHLANNHALDRGPKGLHSTIDALRDAGLTVIGSGETQEEAVKPVITEIRGIRLGWLAAGRIGRRPADSGPFLVDLEEESLIRSTRAIAPDVDCLIVSLHCGYMWLDYPSPAIRSIAHRLADAGAGLILMHHPHVLQGVEVTPDGCVICYSLGNFLFDWEVGNVRSHVAVDRQREGAIFRFEIDRKGVALATIVPTTMDDECRVVKPASAKVVATIDRVERISADLLTGTWEREFHRQRARRNTGHGVRVLWFLARTGRWRELGRELAKTRPRHALMVFRWFGARIPFGRGGR